MASEATVTRGLIERALRRIETRHRHNSGAGGGTQAKQCLICGLEARLQERLNPQHVFCHARQCHATHHRLDQFWQLGMPGGMKRLRQLVIKRYSDVALPDDILCHIILLAFDYRLKSGREYDELLALRHVSIQYRRVIDDCVIPGVQELGKSFLHDLGLKMATEKLLQFRGLRRLRLDPFYFTRQAAVDVLLGLPALVHLEMIEPPPPLILTDNVLLGLTRLQWLSLHNTIAFSSASFGAMHNLTYLALEGVRQLTDDALHGLTALQTLIVGMGQDRLTDLSPLTSLTRLVIHDTEGDGPLQPASISALSNLTQLHMAGDWGDGHGWLDGMTSLQHLSLVDNERVRDAALERLTGLRTLRMLRCAQFGGESVSRMTNMQALELEENDALRFNKHSMTPLASTLTFLRVNFTARPNGKRMAELLNLTYLDLSDNGHGVLLRSLSDAELGRLVNLKRLVLKRAARIEGTTSFPHLTALTALDLTQNKLVTDTALALLAPQLRELSLNRNKLISSDCLTQLQQLTHLYLDWNRLINPEALLQLRALRYVSHVHLELPYFSVYYPLHDAGVRMDDEGGEFATRMDDLIEVWRTLPTAY